MMINDVYIFFFFFFFLFFFLCFLDVAKFFGCEVGAQARVKEKIAEYIVNGAHDTQTLDSVLDTFIEKYVLCPNCKLPETNLTVKRQSIYSSCTACGHSNVLDNKHRIDAYITRNPPKEKFEIKVKASKKVKDREDELADQASTLKIKDSDNDEWATDISDAAVQERMNQADESIKDLIQTEEDGNYFIFNHVKKY